MEELLIEEKAKRYDSMFERLKEMYNNNKTNVFARLICERYFPELKECEDEMMIQYFKDLAPFDKAEELYEKYGFSHKAAIAWLEKQTEHANFRNKIQIGDKVTRNEDGVLVNLSQLNRVAKKQTEQKLYVNDNAKEMFIKALERVEEQNNKGYKLTDCDKNSWWEDFKAYTSCTIEQKPAAWSDEDEKQARQIERIVHDDGCTQKLQKQIADWFKSLKDRVQSQPKQEWSEEDEYYLNSCITKIEIDIQNWEGHGKTMIDVDKEIISWLKSLKERVQPQKTWKPSDEQMNALNYVVNLMASSERPTENDLYYNVLKSLRQQLMKLKG